MRRALLFSLVALAACAAAPGPGAAGADGAQACGRDDDCPGARTPCRRPACREGRCAVEQAKPGSIPDEGQQQGDCQRAICGVGGELVAREDPADVPADDGNPCTRELCSGTTPTRSPAKAGTRCGAGVCGPGGACVALSEIAVGRYHGCLRLGDGTVKCWGANDRGQVGAEEVGSTVNEPVQVPTLEGAAALALGGAHSCALIAGGQARCWGANEKGQLGDGTSTDRASPTPVQDLAGATLLAAGLDHTCAVRQGEVVCWGQHGASKSGASPLPTPVALFPPPSAKGPVPKTPAPLGLSLGGAHSCALVTGGRVRCWGNNLHGQLGDGGSNDRTEAVEAAGLDEVLQIAAGRNHTCALRKGGAVWCWGWNNDGQLGLGHRDERRKPTPVPGLRTAVEVAAGNSHSCARLEGGAVRCWGWNSDGQVSSASVGDSLEPVEVPSLGPAAQLALGSKHSCARLAAGGFSCWGNRTRGQLGVDE